MTISITDLPLAVIFVLSLLALDVWMIGVLMIRKWLSPKAGATDGYDLEDQ